MSIYYFVAVEGLLGIKTNIKDFTWSYGTVMPFAEKKDYDNCKIRIEVNNEEIPIPTNIEEIGKYHYFRALPNKNEVIYYRTFLAGRKLKLKLVDAHTNNPKLYVNKTYYKNIKHRFMNLHSVGYLLTDLASYLLLREGYAPIHSSAFNLNGETTVIFAPPNTGKTLTSMMACMEHGAKYIGEDLAVTDGEKIYSVPWTSTFRYYSNVDNSKRSKIKNKLTDLIPPLELIGGGKQDPITNFISKDNIVNTSVAKNVVLLERDKAAAINYEDKKEINRKLVNLNRYEFNYLRSPLLVTYTFFNPGFSVDEAFIKEKEIFSSLVDNAERSFVVTDNDATNYINQILKEISS